jgi:prepilin-type N-terminal cleavage/methylation domain-containing protein
MECNVIYIKPRKQRSAFTLVEVMVASGIAGVLLIALSQLTFYTGRSFAALTNYVELDKFSRNALDQMIYKVRQADELVEFTPTKIVLNYQKTNRLSYVYSADSRTLKEVLNGKSKTLLKECDKLAFSIFQRNPESGSYDQFPATLTNSAAKLVQVSWVCSRVVLGLQVNTESVQSAKIVIRNQ